MVIRAGDQYKFPVRRGNDVGRAAQPQGSVLSVRQGLQELPPRYVLPGDDRETISRRRDNIQVVAVVALHDGRSIGHGDGTLAVESPELAARLPGIAHLHDVAIAEIEHVMVIADLDVAGLGQGGLLGGLRGTQGTVACNRIVDRTRRTDADQETSVRADCDLIALPGTQGDRTLMLELPARQALVYLDLVIIGTGNVQVSVRDLKVDPVVAFRQRTQGLAGGAVLVEDIQHPALLVNTVGRPSVGPHRKLVQALQGDTRIGLRALRHDVRGK